MKTVSITTQAISQSSYTLPDGRVLLVVHVPDEADIEVKDDIAGESNEE